MTNPCLISTGILGAVGDNTHPELMPPDTPYHGWYTTASGNGYAGLFVIPR